MGRSELTSFLLDSAFAFLTRLALLFFLENDHGLIFLDLVL